MSNTPQNTSKTLFEKVWEQHVVAEPAGEPTLIYIDLQLLHEVTSPQAFEGLRLTGRTVRRPDRCIATVDHNVPTLLAERFNIVDQIAAKQISTLRENCKEFGIELFDIGSREQGIVHVIGPELGITKPGMTIVCGDSHTSAATLRWSTLQSVPHHLPALHLACVFLLIGYGALAGVAPLHGWLPDAAAEGFAPGSIIVGALMVNAPLLVLLRLRAALNPNPGLPAAVLMALGLITLLLGACCLLASTDMRRTAAFAGMAQIGMIVVAIGIGGPAATFAGWLSMTLLALARASVLQCHGLPPTQLAAWTRTAGILALATLPLFALFLLAKAAVWLLLPLGVGVLLTSSALLARLPIPLPSVPVPRGGDLSEIATLAPIWLQLALVLLLVLAMPGPVVDWFNATAAR